MKNQGRLFRAVHKFGGLFLMCAALALLVHGGLVEASQPDFGILVRARGTVQYQAAGSQNWVRATERMRVNVGDKINTGPDGSAVIKLSANNFITLQANAQATVAVLTSRAAVDTGTRVLGLFPARIRAQNIQIDLARGRAVSVLRGLRGQSSYALRTPVATAGVRGTVFGTRVTWARGEKQGAGEVQVDFQVLEGSVQVSGNQPGQFDDVTLGEGQSFSLTGSGDGSVRDAGNVSDMSQESLNDLSDVTEETSQVDDHGFDEVESDPDGERPDDSYSQCYYYGGA